MAEWQVTATTIYCDAVDEHVTIMVNNDWSTRCVGHSTKYGQTMRKETARSLKKRSKALGRELGCQGPECSRILKYRDKLQAEQQAETKA